MFTPTSDGIVELLRVSGVATYRLWNDSRTEILEERPATGEEAAVLTAAENEQAIRDKAAQALTVNRAYLALGTPTNAQVVAQVRALTRENNALVRLLLGLLDDASDI